ncbi:uncharacterized protein N0V89_007016 [Didymosphaeria variabile]|uniref:BTB domain-containing protein n=1 Tax=Didymosphaeria variabile TaxID=1932322 RepID=A0A9W8XI37_9PLEO|nr:uncharacterized protein N0V89_007016 [Didymosphaeria variabile]KAJ4351673.1 hypothetical protein N0V89_007016 [Didymosphaeria variabile]
MRKLDSSNNMPQRKTKSYIILVGDPPCEAYPVDKDFESLLRAASPLLATKLDEQKETIPLPTFEPQDFRTYKDWLHARRLAPCPKIGLEDTTEWRRICQGYLLGDHLQDFNYCNAMADALLRAASKVTAEPSKDFLATVEHVFSATGNDSPIRTLLFDITFHWVRSGIWKPLLESSPKFTAALCIEQINRSGSIPRSLSRAGADICKNFLKAHL